MTPTVQQTQWNSIHRMILKNTCCGNNMLRGIAMDIALLQFLITSRNLSFNSFCSNWTILAINLMKKYILTCETALDIQTKLKNQADWRLKVTIELKNALTHKMRLPVWGYTNGEHLYMLVNGGLMLKYKTYTITSQEDALEAWKIQEKELVLNAEFGIWVEEKNKRRIFTYSWVISQTSAHFCIWYHR